MKKKSMIFKGLGFPVVLLNVPRKKIRGEEIVDINYKVLSDNVFKALIEKPARLSGAEIKFIRHHMKKNQEEFAELIHVERSTISVWEKKDLNVTGMDAHVEAFIRLKMAAHTISRPRS